MPVVELSRVSKHFGSTRALDGVSLALDEGQVHVLAGENGAGKSTLLRILAGAHRDYQGNLSVGGAPVRFASPADAARAGIATIHQELSLVGSMSVTDNLLLAEPGGFFAPLRGRAREARARALMAPVGLDVDPRAPVERLPLALRQRVEIARALAARARVLVMDEPTSALGEPEAEQLFEQVRALRAAGAAVLFVTHRLEEIYRLADCISVLRDGRLVASGTPQSLDRRALVSAMVGRELDERPAIGPVPRDAPVLLSVRDLTVAGATPRRPALDRVSLAVRRGEVLGVAGLQGSGAAALPYALFGARAATMQLSLEGAPLGEPTPARCIARGMVLVSGDRERSVLSQLSVADNAALSSLGRFSRGGFVARRALGAAVQASAAQLSIVCPSIEVAAGALSGGNQQKVALSRALLCEPRMLLLDEPTRGIDVGAKRDVYRWIGELARRGVGVLLVSNDVDELLELCHRIAVLARGRLVRQLERADFSREAVVEAAMGGAP